MVRVCELSVTSYSAFGPELDRTQYSFPHPHRHCHCLAADGTLRKPLAARSAHALVAAGDKGVRLVLIKTNDARLAVWILLGDLVD